MKLWVESSKPDHVVVSICGDAAGFHELSDCVRSLLQGPADADCHFMTPSFGDELMEEEESPDDVQLVHQLNLYRVE